MYTYNVNRLARPDCLKSYGILTVGKVEVWVKRFFFDKILQPRVSRVNPIKKPKQAYDGRQIVMVDDYKVIFDAYLSCTRFRL